MYEDNDYYEEFDDEEFDESELTADAISETLAEYDNNPAIINIPRFMQFKECCKAFNELMRICNNASVSYMVNKPYKNMGSVSLEVSEIGFDSKTSDMFYAAVRYADNIDIYPLINGKIRITAGFNDIAYHVVEEGDVI